MPAILDEHEQWVDTNGKPLVGGDVYIGVQNADPEVSPQDIFSDRDFATLIANPQALDSNGRTTNKVWVKDRYSITVKDINGVQVYSELDNGEITGVGIVGLTNVQGANTITATASPTITSYVDQVVYSFKTVSINTGPVFLDIDNVGSLEVTHSNDESFAGGQWLASQNVSVVYNATSDTFIWQQYRKPNQTEAEEGTSTVGMAWTPERVAQAIAKQTQFPRGYSSGVDISNNVTDSAHDIDVGSNAYRDEDDTADIDLATEITKQIDANWAVGTNQGGLDTGTVAADSWYHVWAIKRSDTGVVDVLLSLSVSAPTMPANYDKRRLLSSIKTDASANIRQFKKVGPQYWWAWEEIAQNEHVITDVGTTGTVVALDNVPDGIEVIAVVGSYWTGGSSSNVNGAIYGGDTITTVPVATDSRALGGYSDTTISNAAFRVPTTTGREALFYASVATGDAELSVFGWIDPRG